MSFFKRLKDKFSGQDIEKDLGKLDEFESERKNESHEEVEWRDENQDFHRQLESNHPQPDNKNAQLAHSEVKQTPLKEKVKSE